MLKGEEKSKKAGASSIAAQTLLAGSCLGMHALPSIAEGYSNSLLMSHHAVTCSGFMGRLQCRPLQNGKEKFQEKKIAIIFPLFC